MINTKQGFKENKLASLEATLVRNSAHPLTHSLTHLLTGVKCRATSVAKNWVWIGYCQNFSLFTNAKPLENVTFCLCLFVEKFKMYGTGEFLLLCKSFTFLIGFLFKLQQGLTFCISLSFKSHGRIRDGGSDTYSPRFAWSVQRLNFQILILGFQLFLFNCEVAFFQQKNSKLYFRSVGSAV